MLTPAAIFAQMGLNPEDKLPKSGGVLPTDSLGGVVLIVGIGLALATLLFVAVYLSRQKRARRKGMVRSSRVLYQESSRTSGSSNAKVRKRRKSHPDNLPRNPTLGETGGLPPLRPEKSSEPLS
jgi:hypothetical protein